MQSGTASKLADSTALTSDIADLNQLDGMAKETSITNSNTKFPTSAAVVNFVANQIAPVGGLEVIADEDSFPTTQPVSGVVISISNADGLVINSSGVATNARTLGNGSDNVTINNFPASLRSKTLSNNLGLLVSSTGASQIYNYHKLLAKEEDVLQLSDDINDFNNRYRVVDQNPTSDNDAGDLIFNRSTQKLLVYNSTSNAFEEAQSIGNFFISTLSPAFNGSLQDFTITNAPTNAQQIILSIGGVIQKPNSGTSTPSEGFALSGSTIKLAAAPPSGTDYFAIVLGSTVNIGTPSNNTVTSAILQSGSVIEAKLGSGAVTRTKLNLVSTSSAPGLEVKGDGSSDGYLQLNCSQNSHGIKLKSPPHSASQSYTLTFPSNIVSGQFLTTDANGNLSWAAVVTDLVNDSSPQLGANLDTNDKLIQFNDAVAGNNYSGARFGDDDDLWIYHTPGNLSVIRQNTSGKTLTIQNSGGNTLIETLGEFRIQSWEGESIGKFIRNGGVELYFDNSKKFETLTGGAKVTGNFISTGDILLDSDSNKLKIGLGEDLQLYHDGSNNYVRQTTNIGDLYLYNDHNGIVFGAANGIRWVINATGHFYPELNNTYDIGTTAKRVRNIYTNDLNLSNEGHGNDVDGTWGSYTIQEGAEDLFLINKRNSKKYKFNLTEVS